jgi:hypothetical protein
MEGHTFLSWNLPNLISVWLMAAVLLAILYFAKHRMTNQAS